MMGSSTFDRESKAITVIPAAGPAGVTPGLPMGLPQSATTVRVEDGETVTTDGPVIGIKEAVGGCFVLEADDFDAAI